MACFAQNSHSEQHITILTSEKELNPTWVHILTVLNYSGIWTRTNIPTSLAAHSESEIVDDNSPARLYTP